MSLAAFALAVIAIISGVIVTLGILYNLRWLDAQNELLEYKITRDRVKAEARVRVQAIKSEKAVLLQGDDVVVKEFYRPRTLKDKDR